MVKADPLKSVKSILVAVDGSDASYNALATVCEIARHTKAHVSVLHVIEVPRALPLDADLPGEAEHGEAVLTQAERLAGDHRVKVRGDLVQARQAGVAIVDEAAANEADAIALGLGFERPFGRFHLDEVSEYVLEHAPCDVWLFRYAPPPGRVSEEERA
jgi:nucleotide-binding universal stress UspA family protein